MVAAIVDAGPLIALLDKREAHHTWVRDRITELEPPLLTCEPVLTEALHRLRRFANSAETLLALLERGAVRISFQVQDHAAALRKLHHKYRDQPMSLADACLARMAELHEHHAVLTLDSDFTVYRKHGTTPLRLIYPSKQ